MTKSYLKKSLKRSLFTLSLILSTTTLFSQLSGTVTVGVEYPSIAAFLVDFNANGVLAGGGGVTLMVPSGYSETAPAGGFVITGSFTNPTSAADNLTIAGAALPKPIITASNALVVGNLNDAVFKISGTDYVNIAGLDLRENAANTTTTAASNNMTEWGIALLYASVTDGANNCSLIGNTITLNRTYQNTFGIYTNATHSATAPTTSATATGAMGGNSGLKIYSNIISNVNMGIVVVGPTAASDHNDGIDIGGTSLTTGNTISDFGTTGTISSYANVSGTVNGILIRNSKNYNISYNSITSSNGGVTSGTLNGIQMPVFSNAPTGTFTQNINNNNISLRSGVATGAINGINILGTSATTTSSININNNNFSNIDHTTATASAAITFILQAGPHLNQNINNNTFTNMVVKTTGSIIFISNDQTLPANGTKNVNNNSIVTAFSKTGDGGSVRLFLDNGSDPTGTINNSNNNNFSNITIVGTTTITGFSNTNGGAPTKSVMGNIFSTWTGGTGSITALTVSFSGSSNVSGNLINNILSSGNITGIATSSGTETFTGNVIHTLTSSGASVVTGISNSGGTTKVISGNKIYNLVANNASGTVNGILVSSGTSINVRNNLISDLRAPITSNTDAIRGISLTSSTTSSLIGVHYNTIYLNASSTGTNFGTSGIFHTSSSTATTAALDLRNNIIINESVPNGTGLIVALRRSGVALNNYATTSNRNLFYAGTPSPTRLVYTDGTTPQQAIAGFIAAVAPREINSFTAEAPFTYSAAGSFFLSLTGSSTDFLRPVPGITTQVESGGQNISSPLITVDYTGVIRAGNAGYTGTGTNPDLGAYEFEGVTPAPVITLNSVTPPAATQCVASSRTVSVNITTASGTITGANLVYTFNGVPQTPIAMTNTSGSTWEGVIPAATPVNATVTWAVVAANTLGINSSYNGTTYSDQPLFGYSGNAVSSTSTVCSGSPTSLTATVTTSGTVQIGSATTTTSTAGITPYNSVWEGSRSQYLIRASELQATGLTAGNINTLSFIVTASGAGTTPQSNFSIKMSHTAVNTMVTAYAASQGPVYTVFTAASEPAPAVGVKTYTFSTSFPWDGVSNVLVDICHDNDISNSCASCFSSNSTVQYSTTAFNSCWGSYADNIQSCGVQATSTITTYVNRPNMSFTGTLGLPISSVTWMDGAITVGTGNPLSVSPTSTTTYTANITASGCSYSPSPTVTVNVNPLPSGPTASNSVQCGTQVPTASVTSTTGATTPTFKWYDAATGGTLLQSSTSTTFTSNVTATTTMYVSEVDGVTLCESVRTPVTVTVSSADGIQASVANATICVGATADLSVVNTNPTPNQTYTYSWSGPAGSGAETPVPGATVNIATTASGTFTYTVTGVDGSCNAVSTVNVTVNPFTAILSPINITCNGYNNGSFSQTSETCGTGPFTYSVDGGAFGAIPTNLTPGAHSVIVKNSGGFTTSPISITITQPTTTISGPTGVNASVCEGSASAMVSATSNSSTPTAATPIVLSFNLSAQPTEVSGNSTFPSIATTPNIISTATLPAFPAGAVITGVTFSFPNLTAIPNSWQNDVGFGFTGAVSAGYGAGTGAAGAPGNFNYTRTLATGTVSLAGGTVNLNYYDLYNDLTSGPECTFPTGNGVATMTINYTVPTPAAITWWNASTGGTQIGTGSPFETVGTSVLPNTNTPGVYTVYAQGEFGGCNTPTRTAVTVTVNAETFSTLTATACDSYTLNSTTYTASGTYTQLMTNAAGCDSTITLNLTIKNSSSSTTTLTACNTYTWTNGATYTTSGTYSQTLMNAVGCDSVATLVLTINNSNTGTQNTTACDTYTWPATGLAYTTSGVYTTTLTNVAGCDSTVTLNLTINNSTSGMQSVTACNSYTWPANGVTYTVGGNYFTTLTNSVGCDSNVMLMLTINNSSSSAQTVTACDTYTWPTNSTTYTLSGTYTATFTNAVGCDSVVTLNLTINNSITNTSTITECDSYTWPVNGVTYTSGGTYTALFTSAAGCDSTEILNLTINNSTSGSETVTACDTFTWSATGITYSVGGMYMTTLTNAAGCDSNVMLMLTIYTSPTYTQTVTECDTYTWPLNNVTYTTGGTYTTIVPAGVGCDTIVTLQLTINNSSTSTTTVAQCDPYTWTDGNTYSTSGTYTQTLTNAIGCDSVATLVLTVHGYPTATATDNGDASMTASSGTTYEWIDCVSGNTLATSQTYTTAVNGSFAVVVTNASGCADTSDCVDIDYIGIKEIEKDLFSVYPNPTLDQVTISMTVSSANVEVVDAQGKLLQVLSIENGGKIDLRSYETGVYYLRITSDNITEVQRIVKN